jgi:hypothetical protein
MTELDQALAARFAAVGDCIIPPTDSMPSASDVGVSDLLQRKLSRYRPDLVAAVADILRREPARSPKDFVGRLEIEDPPAFQRLFQAVAGAYYLAPEVRRRIGYPGQEAQMLPREGIGVEDLLEGMLDAPKTFRSHGEAL